MGEEKIVVEKEEIDPIDALFSDLDKDLEKVEGDEKDGDDVDPKLKKDAEPSVKDLTDEWNRERQGLLQAVKSEKSKRQNLNSKFDNLSSTVNNILLQKQAKEKVDVIPDEIPVEFTEDGDGAFIKGEIVDERISPLEKKVQRLEALLQDSNSANTIERKANEEIDTIVGEDERFVSIYNTYKPARRWINDQVVDFQRDNDLNGNFTSGQVLDHVVTPEIEAAFAKKFPNSDIVDIVTAGDSQRHFRGMLTRAADTFDAIEKDVPLVKKDTSKFKSIINKPSGLGSATNAKGSDLSMQEKLSKIDASDIMDLSDDQAKALEKALLKEEVAGGVEFE